ncbi:hypothetical protein FBQ82_07730 [Anaerolineae bacterium CFX7]|nr:hypothetical protein [Anaerolineae bacterium CFX7]RIK22182.1 MAG: hypothetical protein DCC52_13835 [Chloroflexota bacterium]
MKFNSDQHHRRSIRLKGYDYTQQGAYFVTIVTHARECLFGAIQNGAMQSNDKGNAVAECWNALPRHFRHVELDVFVMMPNHLHGILVFVWDAVDWRWDETNRRGEALTDTGATTERAVNVNASPLPRGTQSRSLNAVIQNFKSVSTRKLNQMRDSRGAAVWQRNYYEHIIRNERDLERIRAYIVNNPAAWSDDAENPARVNKN